jgi:voltage-gated potassium channel
VVRVRLSRRLLKPALAAAGAALLVGAAAGAAVESDTVGSYGRGLWWAVALMTTVGFIGPPPRTAAGAAISVMLMLTGFLLLSLLSAALASLFVREDVQPAEEREHVTELEVSRQLAAIAERLDRLEARLSTGAREIEESTSYPTAGESQEGKSS